MFAIRLQACVLTLKSADNKSPIRVLFNTLLVVGHLTMIWGHSLLIRFIDIS